MDVQIYLMLCRKVGQWGEHTTAAKFPLIVKQILQNFVLGDSLDVPFVKMIRVKDVSHGISFPGKTTERAYMGYNNAAHQRQVNAAGGPQRQQWFDDNPQYKDANVGEDNKFSTPGWAEYEHGSSAGDWDKSRSEENKVTRKITPFRRNKFTDISKPDHDAFTFTKWVDNATPELAYGCSCQEPYYFAIFFFRRRIGSSPFAGVRLPFMTIGLYKSLITSYSMNSDMTETISLNYDSIAWASLSTFADTNAPGDIPGMRWWDGKQGQGGEMGWAFLLQLVSAALSTLGGGIVAAATKGEKGDSGL